MVINDFVLKRSAAREGQSDLVHGKNPVPEVVVPGASVPRLDNNIVCDHFCVCVPQEEGPGGKGCVDVHAILLAMQDASDGLRMTRQNSDLVVTDVSIPPIVLIDGVLRKSP